MDGKVSSGLPSSSISWATLTMGGLPPWSRCLQVRVMEAMGIPCWKVLSPPLLCGGPLHGDHVGAAVAGADTLLQVQVREDTRVVLTLTIQ